MWRFEMSWSRKGEKESSEKEKSFRRDGSREIITGKYTVQIVNTMVCTVLEWKNMYVYNCNILTIWLSWERMERNFTKMQENNIS